MASIHIDTLAEAVDAVIRRKGADGGVVVAEKLPFQEAAAFDMLMEIMGVDDWVLANGDGVKAMARTCSVLLLLERAVLPALRWRPTNKGLLGVVSASAQKLREVALDAGGNARKEAALLADSISAYADHALQVPQGSSEDAVLRDQVDSLMDRCAGLLSTQCTISQQ